MYPTGYDPNKFVSTSGDRYCFEYIGELQEGGFIKLTEVGKIDLWELHQRDAYMNDVNVLYNRFCNGDITALSRRQGTFLDIVGMPRDLRGMFDMVNGFRRSYDNMPEEFKSKFSYDRFVKEAGSEAWISEIEKVMKEQENISPSKPPEQSESL